MTKDQERIERLSVPVPEAGCWVWMGCVANSGYGLAQSNRRSKVMSAHRLSYESYKGDIPQGMVVSHSCDTPLCVNPNHLRLATHKQNSEEMMAKRRQAFGERAAKAKLTEAQVKFIRESNLSHRKLGEMFNVSHANIGYIKRQATWN